MLSKQELEHLTLEELEFERNRTQGRVDKLQRQACSLERLMLTYDAQLKRDERAAAGRYLLIIERELKRRKGK